MLHGVEVHVATFSELTVEQLDCLYQLRQQVFVVEQKCPYQDVDGCDKDAVHVWVSAPLAHLPTDSADLILLDRHTALVGVARMFAPGHKHKGAALGRIACHKAVRGTGVGKHLVANLISLACNRWFKESEPLLYASAQVYLRRFYEGFGFVAQGEGYLEDDIPHIDMTLARQ